MHALALSVATAFCVYAGWTGAAKPVRFDRPPIAVDAPDSDAVSIARVDLPAAAART